MKTFFFGETRTRGAFSGKKNARSGVLDGSVGCASCSPTRGGRIGLVGGTTTNFSSLPGSSVSAILNVSGSKSESVTTSFWQKSEYFNEMILASKSIL